MNKKLISEEVKAFLIANTHSDLAHLYTNEMELQIIVDKSSGWRVENEDFKGRAGDSYTDGVQKWYAIRIPKKAKSNPENNDRPMPYSLDQYALGIGMTGWNFIKKSSQWCGYDFDAIIGHSERHSKKLTNDELKSIQEYLEGLDYITIRRSTSGSGLHLYVFVDNVHTNNHTEHAALSRYILGKMSAETGVDFGQKVDAYGSVLWAWHKKMIGTNGLKLLKKGGVLSSISPSWKEHIPVISGKRKKAIPFFILNNDDKTILDLDTYLEKINEDISDEENDFLELTGQRIRIPFDNEHKTIIRWLSENGHACSYNQDLHLITTHTYALKKAHEELNLRGIFDTIAQGTEKGDINTYCIPLKGGSFLVKRFSPGVGEASNWFQDPQGYTSCYYNKEPDLRTAARTYGGMEDDKKNFRFNTVDEAQHSTMMLGVDLNLPNWMNGRTCVLRKLSDGRLFVQIDHDAKDELKGGLPGWYHKNKMWNRIFSTRLEEPSETEIRNFDSTVRHLISPLDSDAGWAISSDGKTWQTEPLKHIQLALQSQGYTNNEVTSILGQCVTKSWKLVNLPFQNEYPGNRQWNRGAPQLRFSPLKDRENLYYPTWLKLLNHLGRSLDEAIGNHPWCKEYNVISGADYLKLWIASIFQYPQAHLPYLFFYGQEKTGKTSFYVALDMLVTNGVQKANHAIESKSNFNAELENAIICAIEEINLQKDKTAFNRMKDWVTGDKITIRKMFTNAYDVINCTHWCVDKNTWILTENGPRQVKNIINVPCNIFVDNKLYRTNGFFKTGYKKRLLIETDEGYSYIATPEHKVLCDFNGSEIWLETQELRYGTELYLNSHKDIEWSGFGNFNEGYILGWIFGDGSIYKKGKSNKISLVLDIFEPDFHHLPFIKSLFNSNVEFKFDRDRWKLNNHKELRILREEFDIENKDINSYIEQASSNFLSGFLSALFDTDANVCYFSRRVMLKQSNLLRLEAVQRILLRFGIVCKIRKVREAKDIMIKGRLARGKAQYGLFITKRNLIEFDKRIGFHLYEKDIVLKNITKNSKLKKEKFLVSIKNIIELEEDYVYDTTVENIHMFSGNGFKLHNCHFSNDFDAAPIFQGDSRITMIYVEPIPEEEFINKKKFEQLLEKEGPAFVTEILNLEIPPVENDRLNLPIIVTEDKRSLQESNMDCLQTFIREHTITVDGELLKFSEFDHRYQQFLVENYPKETGLWSGIRLGRELRKHGIPVGKVGANEIFIGNIAWKDSYQPNGHSKPRFIIKEKKLIQTK